MKFNKKFNIKKFVKVSAVALAMISAGGIASTVNANTNVHADNVPAFLLKEDAEDQKSYNAYEKKHFDVPYSEKADLFSLKNKEYISPESAKNPTVHAYLNNHGFSNATINKYTDTPTKEKEIGDKATEEEKAEDRAASTSHNSVATKTYTHATNHAKRTHLSKATIRKIMNSRRIMKRMRADKRAIRKDKKYLSTRSAKRFMRNYTKRSKSLKRTKRIQKRAMAVKGAKRYVRYYKDEVKHEKDLVRLTKSTHTSKATIRNVRRSLEKVRKNIRKNRKNVKRVHKVIRVRTHGRKARY